MLAPIIINLNKNVCIECNKIQASFNYENETEALYCLACSKEGMINIKKLPCLYCEKHAVYGVPCNKPTCCSVHKQDGMIKHPRTKCKKRDCKNMAIYGTKAPIHCELHKDANDISLVERICKECGELDVLINDLCVNTCNKLVIASMYKKHQKSAEKRILNILTTQIKAPTEYNIKIDKNCGGVNSEEKEIGYDMNSHIVFIEVDENMHKSYCKRGEINRMKNIFFATGGIQTPVIFIRYNPDNFKRNGKIVKYNQNERERILIKWVKQLIENKPKTDTYLSVLYLFYDEYDEINHKFYEIDAYTETMYTCEKCKEEYYIEGMYKDHLKICK